MDKHDPPPPYSSEQIYPNKYVYYEPKYNKPKYNKPKYNKPKTYIVYKPKYHGPVINNQPVHKTTKITQTRYNRATNTKTTEIAYIKNPHPLFVSPNISSGCDVPSQDGMPFNVRCPSFGEREPYFEEQKRKLRNKYNEDLMKLEAQKVFTRIVYS